MDHLSERDRRLYAGTKALQYGFGGIKKVHDELGLDYKTIRRGIEDVQGQPLSGRIRHIGGGRKKITALHPELEEVLKGIIKERGNPMKHILYIHLSIDKLTKLLREKGYAIGKNAVNRILWALDFSLQGNKKELHKMSHKDRNKQFLYIDRLADGFLTTKNIIISIDAKKTEKVGNYKNPGKTYQKKGEPIKVEDHDFGKKEKGSKRIIKAIPFGVYDIKRNTGHVNVGVDHNTAEFGVESVRRWYIKEGKIHYPNAKHLMITADSGGANGNRVRQFKWELQQLANETGLTIHVCHYPSGTSKWNKIEHKLFCFISQHWQAVPLQSYDIILGLIEGTTENGLSISAELDRGTYELHKVPTKEQIASIKIKPHKFHPEWNYSIYPIV
jgi:hypothetical protein